jgi:uncharacterized protein (UPF0264 family)
LLVSVRSGAEAAAALAGGADIVDAKEPARGSLGAVEPAVLADIVRAVPPDMPLSVALGDIRSVGEVRTVLGALAVAGRVGALYVKLGFAGLTDEETARAALEASVEICAEHPSARRVVAVAYADHRRAASPPPGAVADLAADAGADGVLLDTWTKDGRDLFAWMDPRGLRDWVTRVRLAGLLAAVAGSLKPEGLQPVIEAQPDIVGVRGAVCDGGRSGVVQAGLVRRMKLGLSREAIGR